MQIGIFGQMESGLHTANLSWQTRIGKLKLVCVNGIKTVGKHVSIWRQQFANVFAACFCAVHTHELGSANTSLSTQVCRVKAAESPQWKILINKH